MPSQSWSRDPAPGSSWAVVRLEPMRHAAADAAHEAAAAIFALLQAERQRTVTVQWMPDDEGKGCRFEIIEVRMGNYQDVIRVDADGRVTIDG